ncbi:hypothetical protein ACFFGT_10320 [Mucilaginibacter angelicae]|uniref:Uncharacterized protein n=1 Tax=Mucilaginibacter angelicae TaxID=869718 RepID=A0ABV6L540_9SPHI
MKRKTTYAFLVCMMFLGCRKEQQKTVPQPIPDLKLTLDQVRAYYKSDTSTNIFWDKATYVPNGKSPYWLVGLGGRPRFQNLDLGYRQLVFYLDSSRNIKSRILEIIPDATYLQRRRSTSGTGFTGRIFIYGPDYHLLSGKIYADGKPVGQIIPRMAAEKPLKTDMLQPVVECGWSDSNYVDGDGNAVIYSERLCATGFLDLGGGDGSSGDAAPFGSPPPVGAGGSAPAAAPSVSNLPGESKDGINPKDFMKCFQNIPDNGATMKITIYVQEPWPGTTFNAGPNSVGHTAISLTKTSGSTSITQTLGFYPDATGFDKMHAPSKLVDNGGDLDYSVSITYDVSAENFNKIVNYISSPPPTYDITDFNCTNFVNSACLAGNINLPNPITYSVLYPKSPVLAPGALGDSIEKLKGNSNVNTAGGNTPFSKGPCN